MTVFVILVADRMMVLSKKHLNWISMTRAAAAYRGDDSIDVVELRIKITNCISKGRNYEIKCWSVHKTGI